jgi:hypothetical protein
MKKNKPHVKGSIDAVPDPYNKDFKDAWMAGAKAGVGVGFDLIIASIERLARDMDVNLAIDRIPKTKREQEMRISSVTIGPSMNIWSVCEGTKHKSLKPGDRVQMVGSHTRENLLFRIQDCTLHDIKDVNDQYIHLEEYKQEKNPP